MVGIGFAMIALALVGIYLRLRGRLARAHWFHRLAILMSPSGFVAVIAGWTTTEVGRQPWVVYGVMRTVEGRSPIAIEGVLGSFVAFLVVYVVVFGAGFYYILRLVQRGPDATAPRLGAERAANIAARPIIGEGR